MKANHHEDRIRESRPAQVLEAGNDHPMDGVTIGVLMIHAPPSQPVEEHIPPATLPLLLIHTLYFLMESSILKSAPHPKENVWDYPRPPALERTSRHLKVVWIDENNSGTEVILADTTKAWRVLETSHPPTYYIPKEDINMSLLTENTKHTFCEWKGAASYYDFSSGSSNVNSRIWTYKNPSDGFKITKDHLAFYASPWQCFVDGELVQAQPGNFYGGWMTSDIDGGKKGVKGAAGTEGW
ncbi:hypothetical protein FRB93_006692 [Tulasnella sp. JGI-2019a]|nr:hypothetical protein FRB93_006692 [Tulasnella sp. JGI-2019a]